MPAAVETMVSGFGMVPWHRLGTVIEGAVPFDRALELGGIDWEVAMQPVFAGPGVVRPLDLYDAPDYRATVRTSDNKVLGIMSPTYTPVQNREALDFLGVLLEGGDVQIETIGALRGGKVTFVCARLDQDMTIGGETHVPYIVGFNSFDGSLAFGAAAGPVRVVCMNTLNLMLRQAASSWRLHHTTNVADRVQEAREMLRLTWSYYGAFRDEVERMMADTMHDAEFDVLMRRVFPDAPKREGQRMSTDDNGESASAAQLRVVERRGLVIERWLTESDSGNRNAWGALNAINGYELWERPSRSEAKRSERMAMSVLHGRPQPLTAKAHSLLIAR